MKTAKNPRGAGRKKTITSYSDTFKKNLWKALEKKAKEEGKTIFDCFADKAMASDVAPMAFGVLWKSLCDVMATRETKSTVEKHEYGPSISLPPIEKKSDFEDATPRPVASRVRPN